MFFRKIKLVMNNENTKEQETLFFAARELQKYLRKSCNGDFPIIPVEKMDTTEDTIYLGIDISGKLPEVKSKRLDDAINISVKDYVGIIEGDNARSVLLAVYRFLKEVGFYFLRPGDDGEIIPQITDKCDVSVCEVPSNRHRGICMEGTIYQENLFDIIDWLPKVGLNSYFTQFKFPKVFLDRYYKVRHGVELTNAEMLSLMTLVTKEIEKRSLLYHAIGHGWTCEAFGVEGISWDQYNGPELTKEQLDMMALVDGERKLFTNIPTNTNLCYSNDKVRDKITNDVVNYCKQHSEIDFLHFWLSDGYGNTCECENCKGHRLSDFYVMMLNEIDAKLTAANLDTKIAFLIYCDLLWAPREVKFNNPDRFLLMFAPISRSYSAPFDISVSGTTKEYSINKNEMPLDVPENLAYLYEWQKVFDGDGFDFDYHFMWDHYYDFSYMGVSEILHADICNLKKLNLNGLINCQLQRVFLPTGLGMHTTAQTLWDTSVKFDDIVDEVLSNEYGKNYKKVKNYLWDLHKYGCSKGVRGEENLTTDENKEKLLKTIDIINNFKATIDENIVSAESDIQKKSWQGLMYHGKLYQAMLNYYHSLETDKEEEAQNYLIETTKEGWVDFKDVIDASGLPKIIRQEMKLQLDKSLALPK